MKIKRSVINSLILISTGNTKVYTGEKCLKIRVLRLAKNSFLTHFHLPFVAKPNQLFFLNLRKIVAMRCIIDASTKTLLGTILKVSTENLLKKWHFLLLDTHTYV